MKSHHRQCGHHKNYHLTCAQMDDLEARAEDHCELCGRQERLWATAGPCREVRLFVDHDHAVGFRAVRGIVCGSCNDHLGVVDRRKRQPTDAEARYLRRAWYLQTGLNGACPPECSYRWHTGGVYRKTAAA